MEDDRRWPIAARRYATRKFVSSTLLISIRCFETILLNKLGSSPPRDKHSKTPETVLVLDIAGTAPQPFTYCALALRKPDPRRRSTQTWRFTDDGRLCCVHKNMCVQSKDGFMGLYEGLAHRVHHVLYEFLVKPIFTCYFDTSTSKYHLSIYCCFILFTE